ncbi:hypothetical protein [Piscirickettsia litoralis]|uniref:Uncharacterized protein n=1 Tax=Piscirickettsia litoralis TaxID=1891921 RepID=A0ABX3A7R2_9GAMM|nr:hypothetical protein [Piscirickettsia litoralis]ODN43565.1 hypothetical protein BGC07_12385 [Piscirickettsia litoralis]
MHQQTQKNYFNVSSLPAYKLTAKILINKYHKNIVIVNDDGSSGGGPDLTKSQYVLTAIDHSQATPLIHRSIDGFLPNKIKCVNNTSKYQRINKFYSDDSNHYNLFRMNADRTTINYVSSVGNKKPDQYSDYFTTGNIANLQACPVNIYAMNMLGFTCGSSSCDTHPTDPRLYSFLWSWGLGYPLRSSSSKIAYINPKTKHFENEEIIANNKYSVLCYKRPVLGQITPMASLNWYIKSIDFSQANKRDLVKLCNASGGYFATPVTSYWMDDVLTKFKANNRYLLVNYQYQNGQWIANDGKSLVSAS